ncbi:MAG: indolepyruvate ferredoxin oxidoreductase family protein [Alphaproteobacteria bacterium]
MAQPDQPIDETVTIDDKYTLDRGRVFLSGTQALVRLPMMQHRRDVANGLNTAGYITGYRGSPLGSYDQQLWLARRHLEAENIRFQPGINEDLAVTAIWGTQQLNLIGPAKVDSVFSIFYGKGPGIDRSGDALRHANLAGTDPKGGVLALAGDDHTCKSSTTAHASEYALVDAMIPILHPAGVQEILDYGLHGIAMSRFSGAWAALKLIAETVESAASIHVDPDRFKPVLPGPDSFTPPPGGLHIRYPHTALDQEELLHRYKPAAAQAYVKVNRLDRLVISAPKRRLGVVTCGKSYLDVEQALADLGLDHDRAAAMGVSVYKLAMTWPVEPDGLIAFARDHQELFVVEEKRPLIEDQLKRILYNLPENRRPRVVGKTDEKGAPLLPSYNELSPVQVARAIAGRLSQLDGGRKTDLAERVARLDRLTDDAARQASPIERLPYFCSGCPHNTSTVVPEGSRALVGIGCHYMAQWMDRKSSLHTHMGAEGANWIGLAPFSETPHIFANIGDGTYQHSGSMAIRAAIASGATMTYKILFNDAVAMTGGQPPAAGEKPVAITADRITRMVYSEGVRDITVVVDDPDKYPVGLEWAPGVRIEPRKALDRVQREVRERRGVSVLVYDQTCAAEKRRRRKRGTFLDPAKRVFINEAVCEGCGDCGVKSNCVSVTPVETEFGRKRAIDQSSCNKDYSCVNGFCPSFVTIEGGGLRKPEPKADSGIWAVLPEPEIPSVEQEGFGILITGVGGTGVVTIGALLGMAAHLEGKGCGILDMAGLAQKGGPVISHIRIAKRPEDIHAVRIAAGGAKLLLGCDLVVAAGYEALSKVDEGATTAVINSHEIVTGDFTRNPDLAFPGSGMQKQIADAVGPGRASFIDATDLATSLMGDSIATNLFMLGLAYQKGAVPVTAEAIEKAIELNGVSVEKNRQAFTWGRRAAVDPDAVARAAHRREAPVMHRLSTSLDEMIERRVEQLTAYQDRAYAERYAALVATVRATEEKTFGGTTLTEAVARNYYKLLAYKDEYEVARLYTDPVFMEAVREQFDGDYRLKFHLAPPIMSRIDPDTGEPEKKAFGPWMMKAFGVLARFKGLRGTKLDIFGYSEERKHERALIGEYEALVDEVLKGLSEANREIAAELLSVPAMIRGFGHVKERNIAKAKATERQLLAAFRDPGASPGVKAAE